MQAILNAWNAHPGWLRSPRFDLVLVVGIPLLAIVTGLVAVRQPEWLPLLVLLDLWLLGFHHVISTYTRLCFDAQSVRRHWFLLFGLPPLVLTAVLTLVLTLGPWSVATIYFYWQWFHYARQSYGVSRAYRGASGGRLPEPDWLASAVIYLSAAWGILARSAQGPDTFLGMELRLVAVPAWLPDLVGLAALLVLATWLAARVNALRRGQLPLAHTLYVLSHVVIFYVGYVLIRDITTGWLVANMWHNAQYILFVWLFNNRRFEGRIDPSALFLSTIAQRRNLVLYMAACLTLSTAVYTLVDYSLPYLALPALAAAAVIYQTINFHHYIVDAVIWRRPKRAATAPAHA